MKETLRSHITAPYRCYTGVILTEGQVYQYNGVQDEINRYITAGVPVPEWLLNWSHKLFSLFSDPEWLQVDK